MLGIAMSHTLVCQDQHGVARQDSRVGIPFLVYSQLATTHIGIVHQVVVQQSIVMIRLQRDGIHQNLLRILLIKIVRHQHQGRANALATHG